jgi:hypothetical protein
MRTTHIPFSGWKRAAIIVTPCVINWIVFAAFIAVRSPATALIEERERAEQMGAFTLSSADPLMVIAERPLYQWNQWHGGEVPWVKVAEVMNGPAFIAAQVAGSRWLSGAAFGDPTYRRQSWVRAYVFLVVATLQWLILGAIAAWVVGRRRDAKQRAEQASP